MTYPCLSRPITIVVSLIVVLAITSACGGQSVDTGSDPGGGDDSGSGSGSDDGAAGGGTSLSIAGTWALAELVVDGEPVTIPAGARIEMTIEAGQISGGAGCNQFGGTIDRGDDGSLSIGDLFATEMGCEHLDFESVYLGALSSADGWEGSPPGITFSGPTFSAFYTPVAPVEPAALFGTTWHFDTIYSGTGVDRAASSTDMSAEPVTLTVSEQSAVAETESCGRIEMAVKIEPGTEGSFSLAGRPTVPEGCDLTRASNLAAAIDGLEAATGYMIHEQRLTFIGLEGETVGFTTGS